MLSFASYPGIYRVTIGANDKSEKEHKAKKQQQKFGLNYVAAHFEGKVCSGLSVF